MTQFDVVANPIVRLRAQRPYLILLQADRLRIATRHVVGPLLIIGAVREVARLTPRIIVQEREYVFYPLDIGALALERLGAPIANVEDQRYSLIGALDYLFTGS